MNSGGIARNQGGNTRDSGVNGLNDFFENTKTIQWANAWVPPTPLFWEGGDRSNFNPEMAQY